MLILHPIIGKRGGSIMMGLGQSCSPVLSAHLNRTGILKKEERKEGRRRGGRKEKVLGGV